MPAGGRARDRLPAAGIAFSADRTNGATPLVTVLIECGADAARLGETLASLVPGAVEGLVRGVVVLDRGLDPAAWAVADQAGCDVLPADRLTHAVTNAKGDWLLVLEPGARLVSGWIEGVAEHLCGGATPRAARFLPARRDRPRFLQRLRRSPPLRDGLLLPKDQAIGLARSRRSLADIATGLATVRLEAEIRPRPAGE